MSDARWLRVPEDEKAKLKRLLAEAMLDNAMFAGRAHKPGFIMKRSVENQV